MEQVWLQNLKNGEKVFFHGKGNSMRPIIEDGDKICVRPLKSVEEPEEGDIVYCKVKGKTYLHKIVAKKKSKKKILYQIGNNHGHINGWTDHSKIYGKFDHIVEKA